MYECPICGKIYTSYDSFRSHIYKTHKLGAKEFRQKYGDYNDFLVDKKQFEDEKIKRLENVLSELTQTVSQLSQTVSNLKAQLDELQQRMSSTNTTITAPSIPKILVPSADKLKEQLEKASEQARKLAKFITESITQLESVGVKIPHKSIEKDNKKYIIFDIRVSAIGWESKRNNWKIFCFDTENFDLYESKFQASWEKQYTDVINLIKEKLTKSAWRPEHFKGLNRLLNKISKKAKKSGIIIRFEEGDENEETSSQP